MTSNPELYRVAIHESFHAVASLACGRRVIKIVATAAGGLCQSDDAGLPPLQDVLVTDAGYAAEQVFLGEGNDFASRSDNARATGAIAASGVHGLTISKRLERARRLVWDYKEAGEFLAEALQAVGGSIDESGISTLVHAPNSPLAFAAELYAKPGTSRRLTHKPWRGFAELISTVVNSHASGDAVLDGWFKNDGTPATYGYVREGIFQQLSNRS